LWQASLGSAAVGRRRRRRRRRRERSFQAFDAW
jgi:hypothetical protein